MHVARFPFRRCLTIAAGMAACVVACQNPEAFHKDGGTNTGRGGSSGSGGTIGAGGIIGPQGTGGSISTGQGGRGGSVGTGGATGAGGRGGAGGATGAGGSMVTPCPTCKVKVEYACRGSDANQASFVLRILNNSAVAIQLADLKVRYWFTTDDVASQQMNCDYAANGCPTGTFMAVTPAKTKANAFLELGFGAGTLEGFVDTGEIQLRVHHAQYVPGDQTDDYSFDCTTMNVSAESMTITAYVGGALVWGTEPP